MRQLYLSWQSSGLSKKAFALREQITPSTFYYWVKKLEQSSPPALQGFDPILSYWKAPLHPPNPWP